MFYYSLEDIEPYMDIFETKCFNLFKLLIMKHFRENCTLFWRVHEFLLKIETFERILTPFCGFNNKSYRNNRIHMFVWTCENFKG